MDDTWLNPLLMINFGRFYKTELASGKAKKVKGKAKVKAKKAKAKAKAAQVDKAAKQNR